MSAETFKIVLQGFWSLVLLVLLVALRKHLTTLLATLQWRLRTGAAIKLGSFELGACYVSREGTANSGSGVVTERIDDGTFERDRDAYYGPNRRLFLVHRVQPSAKRGQLYDILIYVVPHKDATLAAVKQVDYFFGPYWGKRIFTVTDRAQAFTIATSAYGPFVCTAKIHFSDGANATVWRYIDFEMGGLPGLRDKTRGAAA